jgi:hypothetical protein
MRGGRALRCRRRCRAPPGRSFKWWRKPRPWGWRSFITGLHEDYRLVLDAATLLPRKMHLIESGQRSRTAIIDITDKRIDIFVKKPDAERRLSGTLPSQPLEPIAVLLLMRALRLQDGDKADLVVMDGTAFYQGTMEVLGREVTQSGLGPRAAIKILCSGVRITENGGKVNRPVRTGLVWVSDDAARLPLRVEGETELGKAEFVLTSFEPGRRPLAMPKKLQGITERRAGVAPAAAPSPVAAPPHVAPPLFPAAPRQLRLRQLQCLPRQLRFLPRQPQLLRCLRRCPLYRQKPGWLLLWPRRLLRYPHQRWPLRHQHRLQLRRQSASQNRSEDAPEAVLRGA